MKKWLAILFILLILLPLAALADEEVSAEWWQITDQIKTGENGAVCDGRVFVRVKGSKYTISTHPDFLNQGEMAHLWDVKIDARDTAAHRFYVTPEEAAGIENNLTASPAGTYIFENIAIDGDVTVFAYEWYDSAQTEPVQKMDKNSPTLVTSPVTGYTVVLNESVLLEEQAKIDVYAGARASQGKKEKPHYFNGGLVEIEVHCPAKSISLDSHSGGVIRAETTERITNIGLSGYAGSDVTLNNLIAGNEDGAGSIYISIANKSSGRVVNERNAVSMMLESVENSTLTVDNEGDLEMLNIHTEVSSDIKLTNNGTIFNGLGYDGNSWGDQAMEICIDETSHVNIVGKGTIMPGYQWFDYYLGSSEMKFKTPRPGASVIIDLSRSDFELSNYTENVEMARKVSKRVSFDWDQIESGREGFTWPLSDSREAPPHSVLAVYRDERAFVWPVTKNNVYHPVLKSTEELDVLPVDYQETGEERADAPKVLLGGEPDKSTDVYLNIDNVKNEKGSVLYELEMVDAWGNAYDPGKTVGLYLPYPDVDQPETKEYEVYHTLKDGSREYYSTLDGTLQKLENGKGMLMQVKSFSPFEIVWDKGSDIKMPSTGDNSHACLCLMLLVVSGTLFELRRRRTA